MNKKPAREKALDLLALRDHSRSELITKLKNKSYNEEQIENALQAVETSGWLLSGEKLAEKLSEKLHDKNKSHLYILQYLKMKGLPPIPYDSDRELEKAHIFIQSHFSKLSKSADADKKADENYVLRLLKNRGFGDDIISAVCKKL